MTDWASVAPAFLAPLEPRDKASVIEPLEKLERGFRALQAAVPFDQTPWNICAEE
ncbi:MAG TPA: hypothetical protein VH639_16070 [Bryobacteraceae bacterium]|jgi:hypothetical protein